MSAPSAPMLSPNAPPPPSNAPTTDLSDEDQDSLEPTLPVPHPLSPPSDYAQNKTSYQWLSSAKQSSEVDQRKVWDLENQLKQAITSLRSTQRRRCNEVLDSINASDRPLGLPMVQTDEIDSSISFSDMSLPPPPPNLSRIGEAR